MSLTAKPAPTSTPLTAPMPSIRPSSASSLSNTGSPSPTGAPSDDDLDHAAGGVARLGDPVAGLDHRLGRIDVRAVEDRVDAVLLADFLRRHLRGLVADLVDLLLHLGQHGGLLQEPHVHVEPAFDVELLVERVQVVPHRLVVVRGSQGLPRAARRGTGPRRSP